MRVEAMDVSRRTTLLDVREPGQLASGDLLMIMVSRGVYLVEAVGESVCDTAVHKKDAQ